MRDLYFYIALASVAITTIYFIIQVVRKHLQHRLIAEAKAAGWTRVHVDYRRDLVGDPPGTNWGIFTRVTRKALRG